MELTVLANTCVEVFPGNYEDYLWRKEGKAGAAPDVSLASASVHVSANPADATNHDEPVKSTEPEARQKRLNPIKLKQMKERLHELERKDFWSAHPRYD